MCEKVLIKSAYSMHLTSKKEGNPSKHLLFKKKSLTTSFWSEIGREKNLNSWTKSLNDLSCDFFAKQFYTKKPKLTNKPLKHKTKNKKRHKNTKNKTKDKQYKK